MAAVTEARVVLLAAWKPRENGVKTACSAPALPERGLELDSVYGSRRARNCVKRSHATQWHNACLAPRRSGSIQEVCCE